MSPSRGRSSQAPNLLLVEDVRISLKVNQATMKKEGYKVTTASNGLDAVATFSKYMHSLKIVLMDIQMPGMDGVEATVRIRELEASYQQQQQSSTHEPIVIIGLTGNCGEGSLRSYEACGMNGCIAKGKLVGESLAKALKVLEEFPDHFVNCTL